MSPTLYLVRHAEGEHNVNARHHLRDPHLTSQGHLQCTSFRETFSDNDKLSIVMSSSLKRAIQTACYCFGSSLARPEVPFVLVPLAQEIATNACDIGFAAEELKAVLPEMVSHADVPFDLNKINFNLVEEGWNSKSGIYAPTFPAVERRAALLREWLRNRPEENIALVTHGAFLHYLIEDWTGFEVNKGTGFRNCEVRRYEFADNGSLVALCGEASKEGYVKTARPYWVNRGELSDTDAEAEEARL